MTFAIVCKHFPQTALVLFSWDESVNTLPQTPVLFSPFATSRRRLKVTGHRVTLKRARLCNQHVSSDVSLHCCLRCHVIQDRLYKCFLTSVASHEKSLSFISFASCVFRRLYAKTLTSGSQPPCDVTKATSSLVHRIALFPPIRLVEFFSKSPSKHPDNNPTKRQL